MGWQDAEIIEPAGKAAWEAAPIVSAAPAEKPGMLSNVGMGAARGVKDVIDTGAHMLASGFDKIAGTKEGERVQAMNEAGKAEFAQDHGDSTAASIARVGGNIAGTLPVGGVLGAGVKSLSAAPAVQAVGNAIASGGFRTGGGVGRVADVVARIVGGGIAGGATAGLVDPENAGTGAVIGAALPGVMKGGAAAFSAGSKTMGKALPPRMTATPQALTTARAGAAEGFVVPPVDLDKPGIMTQLLSGLSGKIKTAQTASQRNQVVTDGLARKALGLKAADDLTPDVLQNVRREAGKAYDVVRGAGTVQADVQFTKRLDQISALSKGAERSFPGLAQNEVDDLIKAVRQPHFDAGDAIDATQILRESADRAFRNGDTGTGRAAKAAAGALEDQLERHLAAAGAPDAVKSFQDARKLIAKSYTVQAALNPTTGSVAAPKLAKDLVRGKPLTDELALIGGMANSFPKAMQSLKESAGQSSPLDWVLGVGTGMGTSGPAGAAMLMGRPAVRTALLSKPVQAAAMREAQAAQAIDGVLSRALPLSYRAAPALLAPGANH